MGYLLPSTLQYTTQSGAQTSYRHTPYHAALDTHMGDDSPGTDRSRDLFLGSSFRSKGLAPQVAFLSLK